MRHYRLHTCCIFLLLLWSCGSESDEQTAGNPTDSSWLTEELYANSLQEHTDLLNSWAEQNGFHLEDSFDAANTGTVALMSRKAEFIDSFYQLYGKLLVYNQDSTRFIDFASYPIIIEHKNDVLTARGAGPDQEITFTDLKTDTTTRFFFLGPCCRVQNAFWYNNDIIGLVGVAEREKEGYYNAVIWFIDTRNRKIISYELGKEVKANEPNDFLMKTVRSKGIKVAE